MVLMSAAIMRHGAMHSYTKLTSQLSRTDIRKYAKSALKLRCVVDCRFPSSARDKNRACQITQARLESTGKTRCPFSYRIWRHIYWKFDCSLLSFVLLATGIGMWTIHDPSNKDCKVAHILIKAQSFFSRILLTLRNIGSHNSVIVITWGETVDSGRPIIQEPDSHSFSHQRLRCNATIRLRTSDYLGPNKTTLKIYFHR